MTNSKWLSRIALSTALAGGLMLGTFGVARADDRDDCNRRLEADRARIDRDIARHGEHSHQADRDRDKMEADRHWCRDHKSDWDHDRFDKDDYSHH
jgi:hypothetical protein